MKTLFIEEPKLEKGIKIVDVILVDNKGEQYITDFSNFCDDEKLKKDIQENKELIKKILSSI